MPRLGHSKVTFICPTAELTSVSTQVQSLTFSCKFQDSTKNISCLSCYYIHTKAVEGLGKI